jgi:ssDNA-binding Zn-finger/Zn-ribbon topoisomerase 1
MFADYIAGVGYQGIADRLNAEGIPAPKGGLWRVCSISLMLQNPFYAGHYVGGYYSYEDGKQKRGKTPGFKVENAVPALISQADFDRAQAVRVERQRAGFTAARESEYVLSTLLRCGKCGAPMVGHNGSNKRYYRCTNAKEFGTCDNGAVPAEALEETVLEEIRRDLAPENLRQHIAVLGAKRQTEIERQRKVVQGLSERLTEAQRKRDKVDADYLAGEFDAKQYARLSDRLDREADTLEDQLSQARADLAAVEQTPVDHDRLVELAAQVDGLAEFGPSEVRSVLRQLLASLTVYRAKKRGRWNGSPIELTMEHNIKLPTTA